MRHVNNLSIKQLPDDKRGYLISSDDLDRQLEVYDRRLNARIQTALKPYIDSLVRTYNDTHGQSEEYARAHKNSIINRAVGITWLVGSLCPNGEGPMVNATIIDDILLCVNFESHSRQESTPITVPGGDLGITQAIIQHIQFLNVAIELYLI